MSREILFRGKDTIYQEWIYGDLLTRANYAQIWQDSDSGKFPASVIPETVGQYTGLKDIYGVKVFEGDIVYYDGSCYKVVFENRNGAGCFGIVVGENETWGFGNSTPAYMMVVVGNIYDNPDLLEVSKE